MNKTLQELADYLGGQLIGDPSVGISGLGTLDTATAGQITFLANPKYAHKVKSTSATAVILPPKVESFGRHAIVVGNPYLAFAAMLMAGLDGVQNKIHPGDPLDKNLYDLEPEEAAKIPHPCASLDEALESLDRDREFLTRGGVFTNDMIDEINNKPVYTIHELLEGKRLAPARLFIVGGPAAAVAPRLGEILGCRVVIPQDAEVANAFGAALARTTAEVTLLAETERGTLTLAEEGLQMKIPVHFTRKDILKIGMEKLRERARKLGARDADIEMEIVEDQEFNMVRGFYATGKNIRLKAQVKPGLIAGFGKGGVRS